MTTRFVTVQQGDTLRLLAAQYLGNMARADEIQVTNGLHSEKIYVGQTLRIETDDPPKEPMEFERLGIVIDDKKLVNIPALTFDRSMDRIAGEFSFELPNEPAFEDVTQPFGYQKVRAYWKDSVVFTGRVQRVTPSITKIALAGYGLPGILSAVTLPKSLYPRTRYNVSFEQQAKRICKAYNLKLEVLSDAAEMASLPFSKTEIQPDEKLGDYLVGLAKERGLVLFSNESGYLVAAKEFGTGSLVGEFENPRTFTATYDGDKIYSDVLAIREQNRAHAYASATAHIADLNVMRHTTIQNRDRHEGNIKAVVDAELQRILFSAMTFSLTMPYIENMDGNLWGPGDVIQIVSEKHRIYKKTLFVAQSVKIELMNGGETATLQLVPVSVFQKRFRKFWK